MSCEQILKYIPDGHHRLPEATTDRCAPLLATSDVKGIVPWTAEANRTARRAQNIYIGPPNTEGSTDLLFPDEQTLYGCDDSTVATVPPKGPGSAALTSQTRDH